MAIFVTVLLTILALIVVFHFFGAGVGLLALGMVFLALIIFVVMRGMRHPGDLILHDHGIGDLRNVDIEDQEQEIRKLSE
jgi:hypothetical protein